MIEEDDDEDENPTCKVVLVGEIGVGKTSIISRYIYDQFSDAVLSTTGASYAKKKLEIDKDNIVKLQIWDTAGQERFRALTKIFYQNASAVVIVYDITDRKTFDKIKEYWIQEIKENAPSDIIIALAANKSDKYEFEQVTIEEGKEIANEISAIFKSTSAMLSQGIDELFINIGQKFLDLNNDLNDSPQKPKEDSHKNIKIENNNKNKNKKGAKKKCCK